MQPVILGMDGSQFRQGDAETVLKCQQEVAVNCSRIRFQLQRTLIARNGAIHFPQIPESIAQVVVRFGVVRSLLHRADNKPRLR